jgi:hypothetical protein
MQKQAKLLFSMLSIMCITAHAMEEDLDFAIEIKQISIDTPLLAQHEEKQHEIKQDEGVIDQHQGDELPNLQNEHQPLPAARAALHEQGPNPFDQYIREHLNAIREASLTFGLIDPCRPCRPPIRRCVRTCIAGTTCVLSLLAIGSISMLATSSCSNLDSYDYLFPDDTTYDNTTRLGAALYFYIGTFPWMGGFEFACSKSNDNTRTGRELDQKVVRIISNTIKTIPHSRCREGGAFLYKEGANTRHNEEPSDFWDKVREITVRECQPAANYTQADHDALLAKDKKQQWREERNELKYAPHNRTRSFFNTNTAPHHRKQQTFFNNRTKR